MTSTRNRIQGKGRAWASLGLPLILSLLVATGCGEAPAARPADAELARKVLHEALDAWKAGEAVDAMAKRPSPIRVADEDWQAGTKLLSYQVEPGDQPRGSSLICGVALSLEGPKGRKTKKKVFYNIGTDPSPIVVRQD